MNNAINISLWLKTNGTGSTEKIFLIVHPCWTIGLSGSARDVTRNFMFRHYSQKLITESANREYD